MNFLLQHCTLFCAKERLITSLNHLMRRSVNDVTHAWISQRHHLTITCQLLFFFNNVDEQVSQDESAIKKTLCRGGRKPSALIQAETDLISVTWHKLDPIGFD